MSRCEAETLVDIGLSNIDLDTEPVRRVPKGFLSESVIIEPCPPGILHTRRSLPVPSVRNSDPSDVDEPHERGCARRACRHARCS